MRLREVLHKLPGSISMRAVLKDDHVRSTKKRGVGHFLWERHHGPFAVEGSAAILLYQPDFPRTRDEHCGLALYKALGNVKTLRFRLGGHACCKERVIVVERVN